MAHLHKAERHRPWSSAPVARWWSIALVVIATVVAVSVLVWARDGEPGQAPDRGGPSVLGTATTTGSANPDSPGVGGAGDISLAAPSTVQWPAKVPVTGSHPAAQPGTTVRVQLLDNDGTWLTFPLPVAVDDSGRFATYVELGRGTSRLRVTDPETGATSNVVTVEVR